MTLNVGKELAALQRLTIKELRARYAELFGDATNASNRSWLVKRITWRLQALAEGDLSERARRRAAELANDADLRLSPPKAMPAPTNATSRTMTVMLGDKADDRLPLPGTRANNRRSLPPLSGSASRRCCCAMVAPAAPWSATSSALCSKDS